MRITKINKIIEINMRIKKTKIEFPPKVQASTYGKQRAAQNQRFAGARGRADCGRTRLCLRRPPPASRSSWFPRRPSLVARYRSSSPRFPIADAALTLSLSLLFKNIAGVPRAHGPWSARRLP